MKRFININDVKEAAIKTTFFLKGHNLDFDDITDKMMIEPSRLRKEEDFPEGAKKAGLAKDTWELTSGYNESRSVPKEFEKFLLPLWDKIEIINKLKIDYDMISIFDIVVQAYLRPHSLISHKCIEFAYKTNTEIDFELYFNDPPEGMEFPVSLLN